MPRPRRHPRHLAPRLREALRDTPAVLIHGPRQCGKTTLAKFVGERRGFQYFSFDDDLLRRGAVDDPVGFVARLPERAILDEVQRVPELFTSLKESIDRRRRPGRFILTGSANVLLVPKLADSLAGRMGILRLHPLSQSELADSRTSLLESLFGDGFPVRRLDATASDLTQRVVAGGFPAALALRSDSRRAAWYRDYVETQIQRDVRDLSRIRSLEALPRLLALAASHTARLINFTELAGSFQLTRQTIHDYVTVLERVFLIERLPPWHSNRLSRLVKTPKLHIGDTGVACALLARDVKSIAADRDALGPLLETFVFQELRRIASARPEPTSFFHFRDRDGAEVDFVLEHGGHVAGVEVKSAATVSAGDFKGLRKLAEAAGDRFANGIVLYDGHTSVGFGERLHAVPISALWQRL